MKKLSLSLDDLTVESFDTHVIEARPGTVRANEERTVVTAACDTCYVSCDGSACPATVCEPTCDASCGDTCTQWVDCPLTTFQCG